MLTSTGLEESIHYIRLQIIPKPVLWWKETQFLKLNNRAKQVFGVMPTNAPSLRTASFKSSMCYSANKQRSKAKLAANLH